MAVDAHKNFAYSTILTAPSPASSGTSLVVQSGDGTKFPAVSFNAIIWPAGTQPTTTNAEIVRVTAVSTDTFTITRTQESTSARAVVVGDQISATITAKTLTDVEAGPPTTNANLTGDVTSVGNATTIGAGKVTNAMLSTAAGEVGAAWASWTPTLANITLGNGTLVSNYVQIGKTVVAYFSLILGTTSSIGTSPTFTLPVTSVSSGMQANVTPMGTSNLLDASAGAYAALPLYSSTTVCRVRYMNATGTPVASTEITATVPFTWTSTDGITVMLMYQAA